MVTRDLVVAGMLVSHLCFLGALMLLFRLTVLVTSDAAVARRTVLYIAIFPTALFFSAIYTESMFLLFAAASFYFARQRTWWWAGIFGALASVTRIVGVLLIPTLLIEFGRAHGLTWRALIDVSSARLALATAWEQRGSVLAIGLTATGLLAFIAYNWLAFDDPLAFMKVQEGWRRHFVGPLVATLRSVALLTMRDFAFRAALDLGAMALTLAALPLIWRRLHPGYAIYVALVVLLPAASWNPYSWSIARYILAAFPIFMLLGMIGRRPIVHHAITATSAIGLGVATAVYAGGFFVA